MDMVYNYFVSIVWAFAMLCVTVLLSVMLVASIVLSSISRVVILTAVSALVLMSLGWGYLSMIGFPDTVWTHGITADSLSNGIYIVGLFYVVWSVVVWGLSQICSKDFITESFDCVLTQWYNMFGFGSRE